jgi:hypothetical protein
MKIELLRSWHATLLMKRLDKDNHRHQNTKHIIDLSISYRIMSERTSFVLKSGKKKELGQTKPETLTSSDKFNDARYATMSNREATPLRPRTILRESIDVRPLEQRGTNIELFPEYYPVFEVDPKDVHNGMWGKFTHVSVETSFLTEDGFYWSQKLRHRDFGNFFDGCSLDGSICW